jgi:hypothetical protein
VFEGNRTVAALLHLEDAGRVQPGEETSASVVGKRERPQELECVKEM